MVSVWSVLSEVVLSVLSEVSPTSGVTFMTLCVDSEVVCVWVAVVLDVDSVEVPGPMYRDHVEESKTKHTP